MGNAKDKNILDEFDAWFKAFDETTWGDSKAKKSPLYCDCLKPNKVKRGFSHVIYDFCTSCKKEVLKE